MRKKALMLCSRIARFAVLTAAAGLPMSASVIGTYDVNYRFNAGGCIDGYPNNVTPSSGNPYYCSTIPPGPVFIPAAPGTYEILTLALGTAGPTAFSIWDGDANNGTRTVTTGLDIGDTFLFEHTSSAPIVFYYWDWFSADNPSNISIQVQLSTAPVPEPGSALLLIPGILAIAYRLRRRKLA